MFFLGGNAPRKITIYASDGVTPQNATLLTYTVTLPDLTVQGPTTLTGASGVYTTTAPTTQTGRYLETWTATGTNADVITTTYDVRGASSLWILSLEDGRAALNMTKTVNDRELMDYLDAVTDLIEGEIGAVLPRSVSETVEIWRDYFVTRQPIISLTSLTPVRSGGITLLAADYAVLSTNKVVRKDGAWIATEPWNLYTAVYQAGRATINPRIFQAARVLLQHLWLNQRGSAPTRDADAYTPPFTMPNSVREALSKLQSTGIG